MEFGVPAAQIQAGAAEKAAKPRGKLNRIARVEVVESHRGNRHCPVRFHFVAMVVHKRKLA